MKSRMKLAATALVTSALIFGAHTALAQNAGAQNNAGAAPQAQSTPMQVDDETVSNFVDAYTDVREIHSEYTQKLQSAQDPQQANNIQQEAQRKMEEAVTNNDISVEQYMRIAQQIGQDPQLRSRIQAKLEQTSGS